VALLLDAWEALWGLGRRAALVLVGQRWFGAGVVEARVQRLQERSLDVRPLGHLPEDRLLALMQRATAFVFPSQYEGFGLPPLEAMRLGAPVVVSSAGALPEVCGEAARYVAPDRPEELVRALEALLDSPEERRLRAEAGRRWARRFTWARAAEQTADVYRRALAVAEAR
jgi:glycosyltransferase involved in cell wall biosynthesis